MSREVPPEWDRELDIVVVGSGTGLVAALKASTLGVDALVLEKAPEIGGTTAISGAGLWVPNSDPVIAKSGETPVDKLKSYMRRVVGDHIPEELIDGFLERGPEAVDFLDEETAIEWQTKGYPDYHPEWEGGSPEGRCIEPGIFDGNHLGDDLKDMRNPPWDAIPVTTQEMMDAGGLVNLFSGSGIERFVQRREDNKLVRGQALIAGLYERCLEAGVEVEIEARAEDLVIEDDEVCGIVATIDGEDVTIGADAVIVCAGGIEWDKEMKANFLRGPLDAPQSPPYNEGDGIELGQDVGAKLGNMNEAWWFPSIQIPGEEWETGDQVSRPLQSERTVPHSIMVNEDGERFCNEAGNYIDLTKTFHHFDQQKYGYKNIPAYLIVDNTFRQKYSLPTVMPEDDDPEWLHSWDSLVELADDLGIDANGLTETVERFNEHAKRGEDPDFGRGESAHDRILGDAETSHPNLGPVETPPYYALKVKPGALGTKGGLRTTPDAEVLDVSEEVIPGLYASGNTTSHVMGIGYAGAGATLGPNVTFAYIAGENAANDAR